MLAQYIEVLPHRKLLEVSALEYNNTLPKIKAQKKIYF